MVLVDVLELESLALTEPCACCKGEEIDRMVLCVFPYRVDLILIEQ